MAKIFIIDDNPVMRKLMKNYIAQQGEYEVATAEDGKSGIERLFSADESLPDLIFTDVLMPDLNGFEVARVLKMNERTKGIPIVFVTANNDQKSKERAHEAGAAGYISKPFHKEDVLACIKKHVPLIPSISS